LVAVRTSPSPAPLVKGKGVVIVPLDVEEDSAEGPVFKRRRTTIVAASHSTSNANAESLREHSPSASTPPNYMALGEGAETAPELIPAPAPELPQVVQHMLKGFQQVPPESPADEAVVESVAYCLGEFFSHASSWRHQTETRARDYQALAEELALVKEQTNDQARRWLNQEAALQEALKVVRKAEEADNKKLHEVGQTHTELLTKVVPLHEEIVELKAAVATSKTKMATLEERCVTQEVNLGKVEADLAIKNEAFDTMKAELIKQLAEKAGALANMEKELSSQAERSQKVEKELFGDVADAFAAGFEEALSQVVCEHPEMDVSNYAPTNHVVEGKVVPRDFSVDN